MSYLIPNTPTVPLLDRTPLDSPGRKFFYDPPIKVPCWRCGKAMTIQSKLCKVMVCQSCLIALDDISIPERRELVNADPAQRGAIIATIEAARRCKPALKAIHGAPVGYAMAQAGAEVDNWCHGPAIVATLGGLPGRGKTWQAWGAIRTLGGQMIHAADLGRDESLVHDLSVRSGLVVIDDLGARSTPGAVDAALRIIDRRIGSQRKTMVTTNLDSSSMAAIEPRLASRLAGGWLHRIEGPDRRRDMK